MTRCQLHFKRAYSYIAIARQLQQERLDWLLLLAKTWLQSVLS